MTSEARLQRPRSREVTVCQADGPARSYPRSLRAVHAFRLAVSRLGWVTSPERGRPPCAASEIRYVVYWPVGHPGTRRGPLCSAADHLHSHPAPLAIQDFGGSTGSTGKGLERQEVASELVLVEVRFAGVWKLASRVVILGRRRCGRSFFPLGFCWRDQGADGPERGWGGE